MIMFFSGSSTVDNLPDYIFADPKSLPGYVLDETEPGVMLTYWEMAGVARKTDTIARLKRHKKRRKHDSQCETRATS